MCLKLKVKSLATMADSVKEDIRNINILASKLCGVVATVPDDAAFPLSAFRGKKVILHNVGFDTDSRGLAASIQIPYGDGTGPAFKHGGQILKFKINEDWF